MPIDEAYRPDPRFSALGPAFADPVAPARFPRHRLRFRNQRWAQAIGLGGLDATEWEAAFARFEPLPANMPQPLAMRYHGHQFRVYNPEIGDGRGFLFAQVRDGADRLLDLAAKGSGQTPYSRSGDGRLTLKGGVREILAASLLEALGVYTSKAFSLFETGEALTRGDEPSPTRSAVLVRLSHSHIRFGTFQRLAYFEDRASLATLIAHVGEAYHPEILAAGDLEGQTVALFHAVTEHSARLAAQWMAAGFVHGVLNTDNLNVTGESFDYGPWRFLPKSDPGFTAAYFDHAGLYAFARQPEAVGWALSQLGGALSLVCPIAALEPALARFPESYRTALAAAVLRRLGLQAEDPARDLAFANAWLSWLTQSGAGWAQAHHDWLSGPASEARANDSPQADLYAEPAFAPLRTLILARTPDRPERLAHDVFQRPRPCWLLWEELEAIWAPIAAADDWSAFEAKLAEIEALRRALGEHPEALSWSRHQHAIDGAETP